MCNRIYGSHTLLNNIAMRKLYLQMKMKRETERICIDLFLNCYHFYLARNIFIVIAERYIFYLKRTCVLERYMVVVHSTLSIENWCN